MLSQAQQYEIDTRFTYHRPKGTQPERYEMLRDVAKRFAVNIMEMCPDSRERSLALTALEETCFWANASIARREDDNDAMKGARV